MAGFFKDIVRTDKFQIKQLKYSIMKKVFMLLSTIVLASVVIQQLLGEKPRKHIRSRKDDPTIPQISTHAF
jgi:hypothetical protein